MLLMKSDGSELDGGTNLGPVNLFFHLQTSLLMAEQYQTNAAPILTEPLRFKLSFFQKHEWMQTGIRQYTPVHI